MSPESQTIIVVLVAIALVVAGAYTFGRSARGRRLGNRFVGPENDVVVRCRDRHFFSTVWVPGMSFKAIRLGLVRFQYCPVGEHWTFVVPVDRTTLTDAERRSAEANRDARLP